MCLCEDLIPSFDRTGTDSTGTGTNIVLRIHVTNKKYSTEQAFVDIEVNEVDICGDLFGKAFECVKRAARLRRTYVYATRSSADTRWSQKT